MLEFCELSIINLSDTKGGGGGGGTSRPPKVFLNNFSLAQAIKTKFWLIEINPIWTGLFANLKRLAGQMALPPNLAISSQMMMKLSKDMS